VEPGKTQEGIDVVYRQAVKTKPCSKEEDLSHPQHDRSVIAPVPPAALKARGGVEEYKRSRPETLISDQTHEKRISGEKRTDRARWENERKKGQRTGSVGKKNARVRQKAKNRLIGSGRPTQKKGSWEWKETDEWVNGETIKNVIREKVESGRERSK